VKDGDNLQGGPFEPFLAFKRLMFCRWALGRRGELRERLFS